MAENITCGEGGAILTADKVFSKIRDIRLLGVKGDSIKRYSKSRSWEFDVVDRGWRYHLGDISCNCREQLKKIDSFKERRKNSRFIYFN